MNTTINLTLYSITAAAISMATFLSLFSRIEISKEYQNYTSPETRVKCQYISLPSDPSLNSIDSLKINPRLANIREIVLPQKYIITPTWWPDGNSFLAYSHDNEKGTVSFYKVNYRLDNRIDKISEIPEVRLLGSYIDKKNSIYLSISKKVKSNTKTVELLESKTKDANSKSSQILRKDILKSIYGPFDKDQYKNWVVYSTNIDDGHSTIESDIVLQDRVSKREYKLTSTIEVNELFPFFHPSGNQILFWVIEEEGTRLFISDLILEL